MTWSHSFTWQISKIYNYDNNTLRYMYSFWPSTGHGTSTKRDSIKRLLERVFGMLLYASWNHTSVMYYIHWLLHRIKCHMKIYICVVFNDPTSVDTHPEVWLTKNETQLKLSPLCGWLWGSTQVYSQWAGSYCASPQECPRSRSGLRWPADSLSAQYFRSPIEELRCEGPGVQCGSYTTWETF